jgi:hypothetical protein
LLQQWIHSLCCVRVREPLTFRNMAYESSRWTACVRATGARFSIRPGLPLLPTVETITVLCSGQKPSDVRKHGTGKIKMHGLCKGCGRKVPIQVQAIAAYKSGYTHSAVFG